MTRSVQDAARMLGVMAGAGDQDPMSARVPVEAYEDALGESLEGVLIGVDEEYCTRNVDPELSRSLVAARQRLQELGVTFRPVSMPDIRRAVDAFVVIFHAELASVHRTFHAKEPHRYGPHFRAMIEIGLETTGPDYAAAHEERLRFKGRLEALLLEVDVLLCPPALTAAPPVEAMLARQAPDRVGTPANFADMKIALAYTTPYDLAGVPTLTVPSGFRNDGIPLAIQLVSGPFRESVILRVGHAYEQATEWHERRPPCADARSVGGPEAQRT